MVKRLLAIIMVSLIFLSGCAKKEAAVPALAVPISGEMETAVVTRGDIFQLTTYDAEVYPDLQEVFSPVDGGIKEIPAYLGQEVKQGDVLIYLDDTDLKNQLTKLEESQKDAKTNNNYDNMQQDIDMQILQLNIEKKIADGAPQIEIAQMQADLEKQKLVKQQTLEMQQYNIKKTQSKIDELNKELEKMTIKAPCSGSVVYLNVTDRVGKNGTVAIITEDSKLHIQSSFNDPTVLQRASQVYAAINGKEYEIASIPFTSRELALMKNNGAQIESGYSIKGDTSGIKIGDYACISIKNNFKQNVLTIPKSALYNDTNGYFVYRVADGKIERSSVEVGIQTDIQVEILNGLAEGDVIYVQE